MPSSLSVFLASDLRSSSYNLVVSTILSSIALALCFFSLFPSCLTYGLFLYAIILSIKLDLASELIWSPSTYTFFCSSSSD